MYNFFYLDKASNETSDKLRRYAYPKRTMEKLKKMCKIADVLREPATFIVIHNRTKIPRSTLSGLLKEMVKFRVLEKEENLYKLDVPRRAFIRWIGFNLPLHYKDSKRGHPRRYVKQAYFFESARQIIGKAEEKFAAKINNTSDEKKRKEMLVNFWIEIGHVIATYFEEKD